MLPGPQEEGRGTPWLDTSSRSSQVGIQGDASDTQKVHELFHTHSLSRTRTSAAGPQEEGPGTSSRSSSVGTQGDTAHHDEERTSGKEEG